MRINPFDDESSRPVNSKKKAKDVRKSEKGVFGYFLEDEEEKDLDMIVKEIVESGNALSKSPTEENMNAYKSKIRAFLGIVKKYLYSFSEVNNMEEKHTRFYFIVDKINEEIENISKKIMESEKSTLYFTSKVSEINGLIMDLYR